MKKLKPYLKKIKRGHVIKFKKKHTTLQYKKT